MYVYTHKYMIYINEYNYIHIIYMYVIYIYMYIVIAIIMYNDMNEYRIRLLGRKSGVNVTESGIWL